MAAKKDAARKLLELLSQQKELTASNAELGALFDVTPRSAKAAVSALRTAGLIEVDYRASNAAAGDLTGRTMRLAGGVS